MHHFFLFVVPTLRTLLNELAPVKHKWHKICIQLGISNSELSEFKKIRDDPLIEGLDYWLNGNTDVPITWGSVVAVLESPDVRENLLAEKLRKKWTTSKESEQQVYEKKDGGELTTVCVTIIHMPFKLMHGIVINSGCDSRVFSTQNISLISCYYGS